MGEFNEDELEMVKKRPVKVSIWLIPALETNLSGKMKSGKAARN